MNKKLHILFISFVLFLIVDVLQADPVIKKNLGFETGTFTGWVGYTWIYRTDNSSLSTGKVEGIVSGRHTIISDQSAYDSNTGGKLKMIPDGYSHSAKLGSDTKGGRHQSLSYTLKIDSTNALLVWKFAVVLLNPTSNHEKYEEPRFKITLYDENGDTIPDCSNYDVYATDAEINGFREYYPGGSNEPVVWRDWTTVGANLLPYYGETVTIEFMSADCTHKGHYGYAYFVLDCMPLIITVDYCSGDSIATLSGPSGFESYLWEDVDGNIVDSVQDLLVENPKEGETYICEMESETGCSVVLSSEVARYEQEVAFSSEMLDCNSNMVQFNNLSTHTKGSLNFLWDFGDGNTSEEINPVYKFKTSGLHDVILYLYNPPSGCTDTLYKSVESFSPPLVGFTGDSTYCPGMETELTAFGAYNYEWSNGESSENINIGDPGGVYWMLGRSSEGCVSDTIKVNIIEEPDWYFAISGDSFLCEGSVCHLVGEGAVGYLWSTDETIDSILVYYEGIYSLKGTNQRGCIKELSADISEVPVPSLSFSLSSSVVNDRNNTVECMAESDDNVRYLWNMGDGTTSYSSYYLHSYTNTTDLIAYPVTITTTNQYGCITVKGSEVIVEPFIPNVFSPNNDGINDLFMQGYDIKIFDRHGILLYSGNEGWDGYYKGKLLDPDTYFYQLTYSDAYEQTRVKKGFITLVL